MPDASPEEGRLARLTSVCLALPEATGEQHGQPATFLVRAKKFVYYLNDHHRDGAIAVCCRSAPGGNAALIA